MANTYTKWNTVINPPVGLMTNTYVNYHEGMSITQTTPSGIHTMPASYVGKSFHVNNSALSTYPVTINVNTQNGTELFTVGIGDSAIFVYSGNNQWDQVGGESIIDRLGGSTTTTSQQSQLTLTIPYNATPDVLPATYNIGTIPSGFSVSDVSINVTQAFNDAICDNIQVKTNSGATVVMQQTESDIKVAGNYSVTNTAANVIADGLIQASFNALPTGSGGTQGSLTIIVEFLAI